MERVAFSRKNIEWQETASSGSEDTPFGEWIEMKELTHRIEGVARGRREVEKGNALEARGWHYCEEELLSVSGGAVKCEDRLSSGFRDHGKTMWEMLRAQTQPGRCTHVSSQDHTRVMRGTWGLLGRSNGQKTVAQKQEGCGWWSRIFGETEWDGARSQMGGVNVQRRDVVS